MPHDHSNDLGGLRRRRLDPPGHFTIAQNCRDGRDLHDLVQVVGDEHQRVTGLGKGGEGAVEILLFVQTHGRGRLIENQHAAAIGIDPAAIGVGSGYLPDRPGNGDQRAVSQTEGRDRIFRPSVDRVSLQDFSGRAGHLLPRLLPPSRSDLGDEEVLQNRYFRDEGLVLMNEAQTKATRFPRFERES